ncbi:MAG: hypothetical protein KF901_05550 [Myxococcales bacterium]|nr:hypothetical protein [Myxococcales bacterium]
MSVTVVDWPPGAAHPFGPSDARFFVRRTRDGACSGLAPTLPDDLAALERIFPPGQTDLWLLERFLLRVRSRTSRANVAPPSELPRRAAGYVILGLRGAVHLRSNDRAGAFGFLSLAEAEAALDAAPLVGESTLLVALLHEVVYWH